MSEIKLNLFSESISNGVIENYIDDSAVGGGKTYYIEGIFAQTVLNRNKRIYPADVLFPEIERYNRERVALNMAWGELDHPESRVSVDLKHASHLITSLQIEGDNVYGKAKIANTPAGETVKGLIDTGGRLSVSTRGLGKSRAFKGSEIMEIYIMTAIDIVAFPSGKDCFVNGVMEGVDYLVESHLLPKADAYKIITEQDKRLSATEFSKAINKILKGLQ